MVEDGVTGLLYNPGDSKELASVVNALLINPERLKLMRVKARERYLTTYTEEQNYQQLIDIFRQCILAHTSVSI